MLETVRIRKEGYAVRPRFEDFVRQYELLASLYNVQAAEPVLAVQQILRASGLQGWQCGRTKVFLKYYHAEELDTQVDRVLGRVIRAQACVRAFVARRKVGCAESFALDCFALSCTSPFPLSLPPSSIEVCATGGGGQAAGTAAAGIHAEY